MARAPLTRGYMIISRAAPTVQPAFNWRGESTGIGCAVAAYIELSLTVRRCRMNNAQRVKIGLVGRTGADTADGRPQSRSS